MAIFKKKRLTAMMRKTALAAFALGLTLPFSAGAGSLSERVDSLSNSLDHLEAKVRSTLMSGGSSPVSFSGEARLKFQYHDLGFDAPGYMQADRSYLQSGWEGNENLFRLGMVASPGRNTVLWSKIGFQHTMVGNRSYHDKIDNEGYAPYPYRHDKAHNSITIHEDMSAGIAVRTLPASFWVRLGNTMWTEASPLTVWKAQPRTFAWEYLPFEVEQPIARYYEYNIAKGEKSGRAAWNKKPFNGLNVESINLPWDLYVNFVYGTFERYDNFEREFLDFAGDLAYSDGAAEPFPAKGHGIGDSYRHVWHGRLAKSNAIGKMTLGLNYVGIDYTDDVLYANKTGAIYMLAQEFRGNDSLFFKEPKIFSADIKGPINDMFSLHLDIGASMVDTVWMKDPLGPSDTTEVNGQKRPHTEANRQNNPQWYTERYVSNGSFVPSVYAKLNYNGFLPMELDLAYIGKGFYSPFSFATPMDAFFAYGSNMVGAGKFIARGEGSPYTQNMAGANLTFNPKLPGYGHLRLKYGQHFNIEEGRDLLFFPYRLNGSDMFSFFHSSFNRWGNSLVDNSTKTAGRSYRGRLGDESFTHRTSYNTNLNIQPVAGPGAGGLRSDFLAMFEGFVPYRSAMDAYNNYMLRNNNNAATTSTILNNTFNQYVFTSRDENNAIVSDTVWDRSTNASWVPESRKYTFNLELDAAYDVGRFFGYSKDLFFGGYFGVHGVSSSVKPLAFSDEADDMLLLSYYLRLEPAIALAKNFYVLALFGFENWLSRKSWMMVDSEGRTLNPNARNVPSSLSVENFVPVAINYRDLAYGLGFDWDMLERVGLHGRVKRISHEDKGLNEYYDRLNASRVANGREPLVFTSADRNDWASWVVSLEIKTWF